MSNPISATTRARSGAAIVALAPAVMLAGLFAHPYIATLPDEAAVAATATADTTRWGLVHQTVGVASGLLVLAFLAIRSYLREAGEDRWSILALPFIVMGGTLFDGRAAGSAQIAHPLDLAPGGPDPTPARDLDDRHGRGARQAALPAANGDEPVEAHRNASGQKELDDRVEERKNPPWWNAGYAGGAADSIAHSVAPSCVARGGRFPTTPVPPATNTRMTITFLIPESLSQT